MPHIVWSFPTSVFRWKNYFCEGFDVVSPWRTFIGTGAPPSLVRHHRQKQRCSAQGIAAPYFGLGGAGFHGSDAEVIASVLSWVKSSWRSHRSSPWQLCRPENWWRRATVEFQFREIALRS
jgi:hypothetical protein